METRRFLIYLPKKTIPCFNIVADCPTVKNMDNWIDPSVWMIEKFIASCKIEKLLFAISDKVYIILVKSTYPTLKVVGIRWSIEKYNKVNEGRINQEDVKFKNESTWIMDGF